MPLRLHGYPQNFIERGFSGEHFLNAVAADTRRVLPDITFQLQFPGLTVDRFESVLVAQVLCLGMELIKEELFSLLSRDYISGITFSGGDPLYTGNREEIERLARKVKELALSPAMLADIVRMADLYNDRAVTRLRRQLPGWTPRNYDFAALVVAGFSAQEISVMLDMTLNGVYTLKSKLKRRIAESGAVDREFFTRFFA
ncbi:MAG: 4Fe-4S cluster-binding domain-containing protein [Alistipes onderdonkii]|nr:4Fe-4S cluster-binding domain-containing protein [Alistipes onderdonkii]